MIFKHRKEPTEEAKKFWNDVYNKAREDQLNPPLNQCVIALRRRVGENIKEDYEFKVEINDIDYLELSDYYNKFCDDIEKLCQSFCEKHSNVTKKR